MSDEFWNNSEILNLNKFFKLDNLRFKQRIQTGFLRFGNVT